MPDLDQLQKLWQITTEQMKKRTTSLAVWQAMEAIVVLDYEEGPPIVLVVGLRPEHFSQSGHLDVPENRNLIQQALSEITRQNITFRIVECGSREDWKTYKVQEERKRQVQMAMASGQRQRAETPAQAAPPSGAEAGAAAAGPVTAADAIRSVDDILDRAYKLFAAQSHRTLAQSRARFVRDAARMLAGAEGQLAAAGMAPDAILRTIDRAIDRIAVWGECDSTTVALEYVRYRDQ